jgi:hypothetical protein
VCAGLAAATDDDRYVRAPGDETIPVPTLPVVVASCGDRPGHRSQRRRSRVGLVIERATASTRSGSPAAATAPATEASARALASPGW